MNFHPITASYFCQRTQTPRTKVKILLIIQIMEVVMKEMKMGIENTFKILKKIL